MVTAQSVKLDIEKLASDYGMDLSVLTYAAQQVASMMKRDGITTDTPEEVRSDISIAYIEEAGRQEQRLQTQALTHKKEFYAVVYGLLMQNKEYP